MNRTNLLNLAEYLESGKLKGAFDMGVYDNERNDCKFVGCMLGHSPYAGLGKRRGDWLLYSDKVFAVPVESSEWYWLFAPTWRVYDNTPEGGAARIRYLLDYGRPPEWFTEFSLFHSHWEKWDTDRYTQSMKPYLRS